MTTRLVLSALPFFLDCWWVFDSLYFLCSCGVLLGVLWLGLFYMYHQCYLSIDFCSYTFWFLVLFSWCCYFTLYIFLCLLCFGLVSSCLGWLGFCFARLLYVYFSLTFSDYFTVTYSYAFRYSFCGLFTFFVCVVLMSVFMFLVRYLVWIGCVFCTLGSFTLGGYHFLYSLGLILAVYF